MQSNISQKGILKFIWHNMPEDHYSLTMSDGTPVEVIRCGTISPDFGVDFTNAEIVIAGKIYRGDILMIAEVEDWRRGGYSKMRNSNGVVLVVVAGDDGIILDSDGVPVNVARMTFSDDICQRVERLAAISCSRRACGEVVASFRDIDRRHIVERLFVERLERKYADIMHIHTSFADKNWNETFYIMLMRSFGLKRHTEQYENIAKSLPYRILHQHRESIFELEALLLGQAGLLSLQPADEYMALLLKTYDLLRRKYVLYPIKKSYWQLGGCRPQSYPYVRLSQLASLIATHGNVTEKILDSVTREDIAEIFTAGVSDYWQTHFVPGKQSGYEPKNIGDDMVDLIIINMVVPAMFAYGRDNCNPEFEDRAIEIIYDTPAENNRYIREWVAGGVDMASALHSQAYLQLSKEYCPSVRCAECPVGIRVLKSR